MVENNQENFYIDDADLFYELVLSKGKGYLTKRAENLFILISEKVHTKLKSRYKSKDDEMDCYQQGLIKMFEKWSSFDERRYNKSLPYITEIFKRGSTEGFNLLLNKKYSQKDQYKTISIDRSNDGRGLHNL